MKFPLGARLTAEFLGSAFLVAAVIGSGIMGERLASGNVAIALLANTLATGAALVALILTFGPISGAHLSPAVTLAGAIEHGIPWHEAVSYMVVQCAGGVAGAIIAHLMFGLRWYSFSSHSRHGWALLLSEFVAAFGSLDGRVIGET
jgi:glycerol uptake facilitator-like aquaporin